MRRVLISGASGLLGGALVAYLVADGWDVRTLSRNPQGGGNDFGWDPQAGKLQAGTLEGVDAVVHLAGESLVSGRWTEARKERILRSRVEGTRVLARAVASERDGPQTFICASGAHYYPADGRAHDETGPSGSGFLAEVCQKWEAAAVESLAGTPVRVVCLRTGMVLAREGGALGKMLVPFKLGLGGPVGGGEQWMSWIAISDWCRLVAMALSDVRIEGALNAVSPQAVLQKDFARALGGELRRPAFLPLPAFVVRLALGQMGEEVLLASLRAVPQKALAAGFVFEYPELRGAIGAVVAA